MMCGFVVLTMPDRRRLGQGITAKRALVRISVNVTVLLWAKSLAHARRFGWDGLLSCVMSLEVERRWRLEGGNSQVVSSPYLFLLDSLRFLMQVLL